MKKLFGRGVRALCVTTALGFVPATASAQTGSIAGTVKDTTGAALPGVTIEASSPALIERTRTAVTDARGEYTVAELRPGDYTVTFSLPGFSTVRREGIELTAGVTATIDAELKVGALEETITVSGQSPVVDVQNTTQHRAVTRTVMEELPTGRKTADYAVLIPGVVAVRGTKVFAQDVGGSAGETNTGLSIHGSKASDMPLILDGMRYSNIFGTGGQLGGATSVNNGMIQEIAIDTSGATAEAEVSGVRANMIPKSGGNTFSGNLFANYMNEHFQADNLDDELRAKGATEYTIVNMWDLNPALGGPIRRDRMWFFGSYRWFGNSEAPPGAYYDLVPEDFVFTPDPSRRALTKPWTRNASIRTTLQTSTKGRLAVYADRNDRCASCDSPLSSTTAYEATRKHDVRSRIVQGVWNYTATNKLLLEVGETYLLQYYNYFRQPGVPLDRAGILDSGTGITYRSPNNEGGVDSKQHNGKAIINYVTGSHNLRTGVQWFSGFANQFNDTERVSYGFTNQVPTSLTLRATPNTARLDMNLNLGMFMQEQYRRNNLTVNAGVRFDYLYASIPAQDRPASLFVPTAYRVDEIPDVPRWKDVSPRLGVSYDLFGNGRTALKWNLGRYLEAQAIGLAQAINPMNANQTTTRAWTDTNGNFVPDCVLTNPAANGECRENANVTFGQPVMTLRYTPDGVTGWFTRGYDWETMVGIQHQLHPGVALDVSYHRRSFGNFRLTQNLRTTPVDFDPFCVTAPVDPALGALSGQQMCGFYDVTPAKFGQVESVITPSSNFGKQTDVYNGVDLAMNARLPRGISVQGGMTVGRQVTDRCFVVNSPQEQLYVPDPSAAGTFRSCRVQPPFQPQFKMAAIYPLPWWGLTANATFQSIPGTEILANWAAPAAAVTGLGRPLSGGARTVNIPLVPAGTMFTDRLNQIDTRLAKNFRFGGTRLQAQFDIYNVLNDNTVLAQNNTYGTAWQRPIAYLAGRMLKLGVQMNF